MSGGLIQKSIFLILVYQVFVKGKDLLKLFKPKPDLPQPLNDFLTSVQKHKHDFAVIRDYAKKQKNYNQNILDTHQLFLENNDDGFDEYSFIPQKRKRSLLENLDLVPQNSIYPFMYAKPESYVKTKNTLKKNTKQAENEKQEANIKAEKTKIKAILEETGRNSKNIHSPIRLRREMEPRYLKTHVEIHSRGQSGALNRNGKRFPDRINYYNNVNKNPNFKQQNTNFKQGNSNYKQEKPASKPIKRHVEINIKSDGKLLKSISENEQSPHSIVLNIQPSINKEFKAQQQKSNLGNVDLEESRVLNKIVEHQALLKPELPTETQNIFLEKNIGVPMYNNNEHINQQIQKIHDNNIPNIKTKFANSAAKSVSMAANHLKAFHTPSKLGENNLAGSKEQYEFEKVKGLILEADSIQNPTKDVNNKQMERNINMLNNKIENKRDLFDNQIFSNNLQQVDMSKYMPFNIDSTVFDYASLDATEYAFNNPYPANVKARSDNQANLEKSQSFRVVEQVTKHVTVIHEGSDMTPRDESGHLEPGFPHGSNEEFPRVELEHDIDLNNKKHDEESKHSHHNEVEHSVEAYPAITPPNCEDVEDIKKEEVHDHHTTKLHEHVGNNDVEEVEIIEVKPASEENEEEYSNQEEITVKDDSSEMSTEHVRVHREQKQNSGVVQNRKTFIIHHKAPMSVSHKYKSLLDEPYHYKYLTMDSNDDKNIISKTKDSRVKENRNKEKQHKSDNHKNKVFEDDELRDRKHVPLPKWKRKRVRQHPKKRIFLHSENIQESNENSENSRVTKYESKQNIERRDVNVGPENEDFIPAYQSRRLKAVESDYDPLLAGFENEKKPESLVEVQRFNKKLKTEGDYADEEDPVTETKKAKYTMIKKIENKFAISPEVETEENDDEYNYPEAEKSSNNVKLKKHSKELKSFANAKSISKNNKNFNTRRQQSQNKPKEFLEESLDDIRYSDKANVHRGHSKPKKPKKNTSKSNAAKARNKVQSIPNIAHRPLTNEENERLFLRHNPDFQRWPRFVRENDRYYDEMKKRSQQISQEVNSNENLAQIPSNSYFVGSQGNKYYERKLAKRNNDGVRQNGANVNTGNPNQQSNIKANEIPKPANIESSTKLGKREDASEQVSAAPSETPVSNDESKTEQAIVKDESETARQRKDYIEDLEAKLTEHSVTVVDAPASDGGDSEVPHGDTTTPIPAAQITLPKELLGETGVNSGLAGSGEHSLSNIGGGTGEVGGGTGDMTGNLGGSDSSGVSADLLESGNNSNNSVLPIPIPANIDPNVNADGSGQGTAGSPGLSNLGSSDKAGKSEDSNTSKHNTTVTTPYSFPDDGNDDGEACNSHPEAHVTICEDSKVNQSTVKLTTMLALVNETHNMYKSNITKEQFLDLNDILKGELPKSLVSEIWGAARGSIRRGLRGGHLNMNLEISNNSDTAAESRLIFQEMTNLMTRLQHATSCQDLPGSLKNYLVQLTRNPKDDVLAKLKEMNDIEFDEHQGLYVFHSSTNDNLSSKVAVLKDLLNKYNNLPPDCKERAEPVKEYIENHLGMLTNMLVNSKSSNIANSQKHKKSLKEPMKTAEENESDQDSFDVKHPVDLLDNPKPPNEAVKNELIKKQLEEVGLGDKPNFSPNFDLDELIENRKTGIDIESTKNAIQNAAGLKNRKDKKAVKGEVVSNKGGNSHAGVKREVEETSTSPQFGKLAAAMRRLRQKRQSALRINKFFGKPIEKNLQISKDGGDGFESPMVIDI